MKQLESKIKTIGGNTFYIRPFSAFRAANLSGELVLTFLPLIKGLLGQENSLKDFSGDKLEAMLHKLLIDSGNIAVELNGEKEVQRLGLDLAEEIFCQRLENLWELTMEVLRVNYGGFFEKLGSLFGFLTKKEVKPSGENGES